MKRSGWYSGDIHVHRELAELPTVMRSEDLNVTLPLMYWVRDSTEIPSSRKVDIVAAPQEVDVNRIIYPVNTEYEIFSVAGKRHTQGAVFVLNHQRPLDQPAPPVRPIARQAELQRGVLDLDKHSWNWSMMIVPIMEVDLFELGNNHHWRTQFGFPAWTIENAPREWTGIETDENGFTERGWTEFGFRTYYALLNCGFRLRVSAGTASGVHPVPLGHSRVYVHLGNKFSYRAWIMNLNAGQSFVTQGPLVNARINGRIPGSSWVERDTKNQVTATAVIRSARPLTKVELIANGEVVHSIRPQAEALPDGGFRSAYKHTTTTYGSTWLAIRCFESPRKEDPADKVIFAHTNPVYLEVPRHPTRPRRSELEYFIRRIDEEIVRNTGVLSEAALAEFREAKQIYVDKLQNARP